MFSSYNAARFYARIFVAAKSPTQPRGYSHAINVSAAGLKKLASQLCASPKPTPWHLPPCMSKRGLTGRAAIAHKPSVFGDDDAAEDDAGEE